MIFAKKSIGGFKEITPTELSQETYVIMSVSENNAIQQKTSDAQKQVASITREKEHLKNVYERYVTYHDAELVEKEKTISQLTEEKMALQEQIVTLIAERNNALAEVEHATDLNINLKRILRQKANSDRGISPVKSHPGYILLRMDQTTERYMIQNDYKDWKESHYCSAKEQFVSESPTEATVWRNFIQTPHSYMLRADLAEREILSDLTGGILESLGCDYWQPPTENGIYRTWIDDNGNPVCGMYRWSLINDVRNGYWTIMIHTTMPLVIPVETDEDSHV